MRTKLFLLAGLFAIGFALSASAGSVTDTDSDGVPDVFDNCSTVANPNQLDANLDGFGNLCDADYNDDGFIDALDFPIFAGAFNTSNAVVDITGDGLVDALDFPPFAQAFNTPVGPSGLSCAGTIPCQP